VTTRGYHRRTIFCDARDQQYFIDLLAEMRARFRVHVLAYVLMGNRSGGVAAYRKSVEDRVVPALRLRVITPVILRCREA
jgi:hypothetical protein